MLLYLIGLVFRMCFSDIRNENPSLPQYARRGRLASVAANRLQCCGSLMAPPNPDLPQFPQFPPKPSLPPSPFSFLRRGQPFPPCALSHLLHHPQFRTFFISSISIGLPAPHRPPPTTHLAPWPCRRARESRKISRRTTCRSARTSRRMMMRRSK
jgi:hypothetical protein